MPWQRHVADVALEVDPDTGRLAFRRVVLTVPRQSGKTTLLLALLMHRALAMGSPQVMAFTAQNGLEARMRLKREWDHALKHTPLHSAYAPSWIQGAEAFMFHNGSRLQVVAGTEKSGHGQTLDLAVVDEAFAQPDGRLEQALSPAMLTRPEPQLWYVSTAGSPSDVWFRDKVERARAGAEDDNGVAFFEWSAPEDADLTDRDVWRACMPALNHLRPDGTGISESTIVGECLSLAPDEFRRAYLNQWVVRGTEGAFSPAAWAGCLDRGSTSPAGVIGVDVTPDRSTVSIGVAGRREDGLAHVELADEVRGVDRALGRLVGMAERHSAPVVVDPAGHANNLIADLRRAGVRVLDLSSREVAAGCAAFFDAVNQGHVRHIGQAQVDIAVAGATTKPLSGGFKWFPTGDASISPLWALTLALYGLAQATEGEDLWGFFE